MFKVGFWIAYLRPSRSESLLPWFKESVDKNRALSSIAILQLEYRAKGAFTWCFMCVTRRKVIRWTDCDSCCDNNNFGHLDVDLCGNLSGFSKDLGVANFDWIYGFDDHIMGVLVYFWKTACKRNYYKCVVQRKYNRFQTIGRLLQMLACPGGIDVILIWTWRRHLSCTRLDWRRVPTTMAGK